MCIALIPVFYLEDCFPHALSQLSGQERQAAAGCLGEIWSLLAARQLVMFWANSGTSLNLDFHISTMGTITTTI